MGGYVSQQLALFLRSIALGGALGLVYDLLRALRRLGGKAWGTLLDAVYCVFAVLAVFFFVLAGDGELRIFVLAGTAGGGVLFFCLLSRQLRPLWDFWLDIFLSPLRLARDAVKKLRRIFENFCKKLFSFARNWITMKVAHRRRRKRPAPEKGDEAMNKSPENDNKRKRKKKRPGGKLAAVLLLVLLLGVCVQIFNLLGQIKDAQAEEILCESRLLELEATNARLKEDIANRDNLDLIEDIARNELGMVSQGEKVFIFSK